VKGAQRLSAVNASAARLRLKPGMTLSDARAMYPALAVVAADAQADRHQLESIADWCERYTPLAALDGSANSIPDGLFLDITGCAHLFGGEAALLNDITQRLSRFGFRARGAIASTPGCAWALSRYGNAPIVSTAAESALLPLPLASLRLPDESITALAEAGFRSVADIASRPRAPLTARFGEDVLLQLDRALGREDESLSPRTPLAPCTMEQDFAEAITREDDVLTIIASLASRMAALLEQRDEGARVLQAVLFRVDGVVDRMTIGTSRPLRDPSLIRRLFADKLKTLAEDYDSGFGFEKIRLRALQTERLEVRQHDLSGQENNGDFGHLIDRLGVRLSPERVLVLKPQDSHIPEFAASAVPAQRMDFTAPPKKHIAKVAQAKIVQDSLAPARPIRLFEKPEPITVTAFEVPEGSPSSFRWRGISHRTRGAEGPERIAMEWWRDEKGQPLTRDYFRVESETGGRLWLYREGLYERETIKPRWFVHGLFA
jgi:protein ImuB